MRGDDVFRMLMAAAMLYLLAAGAAGVALKMHYPPLSLCKQVSYGWFDAYCPAADGFTAPAMLALGPLAYLVDYSAGLAHRTAYEGVLAPIAVFLGLPLIGFTYVHFLIWYPARRIVALAAPLLVAAEVVWDGIVGIYGIT